MTSNGSEDRITRRSFCSYCQRARCLPAVGGVARCRGASLRRVGVSSVATRLASFGSDNHPTCWSCAPFRYLYIYLISLRYQSPFFFKGAVPFLNRIYVPSRRDVPSSRRITVSWHRANHKSPSGVCTLDVYKREQKSDYTYLNKQKEA